MTADALFEPAREGWVLDVSAIARDETTAAVDAAAIGRRRMDSAAETVGQFGTATVRQRVLEVLRTHDTATIDDFRRGDLVNVPDPTWGSVINTLARQKRIVGVGYTRSKRPESHARIVRVWRLA